MRKTAIILLAFASITGLLDAQIAPPDPQKTALIEDLFRVTKTEDLLGRMMDQIKTTIPAQIASTFGPRAAAVTETPEYKAFMEKVFALYAGELNWQKLEPQYIQLYDAAFTKEDLAQIVAFYKSPAGQSFINKMPELMQGGMALSQQAVASVGPQVQQLMAEFAASVKNKYAESPK